MDKDRSNRANVVFMPSGKRGLVEKGTTILRAAQKLSVDLNSICGGRGRCSKCQVEPIFGDFSKLNLVSSNKSVSEVNEAEAFYKKKIGLKPGRRLGCQTHILSDLVVDVPEDSQIHRQVVRKETTLRDFSLKPAIKVCYIEVSEPHLDSLESDFERVSSALKSEWKIKNVQCSINILKKLQSELRKKDWSVTCIIYFSPTRQPEILEIKAGYLDLPAYGLAIDLGSTSIAASLCNLSTGEVIDAKGTMNPQIRYGEDVMSRVSFTMLQKEGLKNLHSSVIKGLNDLIKSIVSENKIKKDEIFEIVFVANPIMHHLLLGIDPKELGLAPFPLVHSASLNFKANEINIKGNRESYIYTVPCVGGHVGADAAAVIISEQPEKSSLNTLIIDIGTNAEIILSKGKRLYACSCPTGPALEGAQISSGQRAAPGAIERVKIDPYTKEPSFKVIGSNAWSNEPNFFETIPSSGITGICGSGIIEAVAEMRLSGLLDHNGLIGSEIQTGSKRCIKDEKTNAFVLYEGKNIKIKITNMDIRAIQLAKAALSASIKILMEKSKVSRIDKVVLAGAFGSHISAKHALIIGLVPDIKVDSIISTGNSAGSGAIIALLNDSSRTEISKLVKKIKKIETAVEPSFQEHFVSGSIFPNEAKFFPELFNLVSIPDVNFNQKQARRRRRTS